MSQEQFDKLVEILGSVGSMAYQAALRQVYVDAWTNLFFAVCEAVVLLASVYFFVRVFRWVKNESGDHLDAMPFYMGIAIGFFVGGATLLVSLSSAISLFVSPQWNAIKYIASLVMGGG